MRRRGELVERPFAHVYDTGGMRRTHLRGHENIYKRLIVHASGFNLGLLMRTLVGVGKPRCLQGAAQSLVLAIWHVAKLVTSVWNHDTTWFGRMPGRTINHRWIPLIRLHTAAEGTFVAVGTTVARRPPHGTVRAVLLHTALTSDAWRQSAHWDVGAGSSHWESRPQRG